MALEGSLRELALGDLLQLLEHGGKTGTLRLRAESRAHPGVIRVAEGAIVGAELPPDLPRIGHLLVRRGRLDPLRLEDALREQQGRRRRLLGEIVLARGWACEEEVRGALYFQLEEAVLAMLHWDEGAFRFEESVPASSTALTVRVAPAALLEEAQRRLTGWAALARRVPHAEVIPVLLAADGEVGEVELQLLERELLRLVDGERTLAAVARELGRSDLETARLVGGLIAAGIVGIGERRAAAPSRRPPRTSPAIPGFEEAEQALRARQLGQAQRLLIELVERYPSAAEVQLLVGRTLGAAGHWQRAAESFARAVQQDPFSAAAYFHLGIAAVHAGDLERAEEALATYLRLPDAEDRRRKTGLRAMEAVSTLRRLLGEAEP